jgi:hypothetical protein
MKTINEKRIISDVILYVTLENSFERKMLKIFPFLLKKKAIVFFKEHMGCHPKNWKYTHGSFDDLHQDTHIMPDAIWSYFNICCCCLGSRENYILCCSGSWNCECGGNPIPSLCFHCQGYGDYNSNGMENTKKGITTIWQGIFSRMHERNGWEVPNYKEESK